MTLVGTTSQARSVTNAPARVACAHCGLDVPPGLLDDSREQQFCCQGCDAAYTIIHGCGLEAYYKVREKAASTESNRPVESARTFADFDDPAFGKLYCKATPGGRMTCELFVEGVHCVACVWLIERLPKIVPGVVEARLDFGRSIVHLDWEVSRAKLSQIARALATLGYPPHPARQGDARALRKREDRRGLIRLAVAGACAGNTMLLALALYAGVFDTMEPEYVRLFRWVSLAIATIAVVWPGSVFFRGAWASLRVRAMTLDVPLALGIGAGLAYSWVSTIRGDGAIYFDSLAMLVFALLVARVVQQRQQRAAVDSVELLFSLTPSVARRVDDAGQVTECAVESLVVGDRVRVLAGECFPVDGQVEEGASNVDESLLTGEARAIPAGLGAQVAAGTTNLLSPLVVRVQATGDQTRAGKLMRLIAEASRRRAPLVQIADRIAAHFVVGVLALAAIVIGAWAFVDVRAGLEHAAAMLIVACPCAVGLATPLSMTVAIGRFASKRVLIKGGDTIERLSRSGVLVLDKTGTLTRGRVSLVATHLAPGVDRAELLARVSALEASSTHPIARALVANAGEHVVEDFTEIRGAGVRGVVDGRALAVGSPAYIKSIASADHGAIDRAIEAGLADLLAEGLSPVLVASEGRIVAALGLGDAIRDDVPQAIATLRERGWDMRILSGDHPDVVAHVAAKLGIPASNAVGGATPEDKLATISKLVSERAPDEHAHRPVVMVGDGVNDAAALAAADVGIAVHGGAEASLVAADAHIAKPGLAPLVDLISTSAKTMRVIRWTLGVSILYNVVAAGLAAFGLVGPIVAAIIMPVSSLTVLAMSLRAGPRRADDEAPSPSPTAVTGGVA
jgi:Cu2+-exporting ATPase